MNNTGMKETKPFYKTSEFWLMCAGQLVCILQYVNVWTLFQGKWSFLAPVVQSLLAYGYIQSRGNAKSGVPYPQDSGIEEFTQPGTNVTEVPES
jgi:hypothetical protein